MDLVGGAVASWLVHSTPDRAVRDLAGDIVVSFAAVFWDVTRPVRHFEKWRRLWEGGWYFQCFLVQ